jgi:hypothetical protein
MRLDLTALRALKTTGLVGLPLAAWLLVTPGCVGETPIAAQTPTAASPQATSAPGVKAKANGKLDQFDDLRERRINKRRAAARG